MCVKYPCRFREIYVIQGGIISLKPAANSNSMTWNIGKDWIFLFYFIQKMYFKVIKMTSSSILYIWSDEAEPRESPQTLSHIKSKWDKKSKI